MQFLKQALAEKKHEEHGTLITYLLEKLPGWEPGRGFKTIHASAVSNEEVKFCPREVALIDVTKRAPKDQWVSIAQKVAFYQGESLANAARRTWFKNIAVGYWKCQHCAFVANPGGLSKHPNACTHCGGFKFDYLEARFTSAQTGASGGIDLLLDLGQPKHKLVEIKTMDKDQFKALKGPLSEHRARTSFYLFLVKDGDSPDRKLIDTESAKILYISKGFGSKNVDADDKIMPFKEYDVEYNASMIQPLAVAARKVKLFREGKAGIPAGVCATSIDPRVKRCACPKECWSGKFPAQEVTTHVSV